jgi:glycosyltransferase involved in cell wall biosynthesis
VTVVPNGVDLDYFQPWRGEREPATLVFSGKMSYHANATAIVHFVDHIWPLIRQERPDVRLRIVGSRPPEGILALTRDPAIEVTGYLPDLRSALGSATIAICPMTVRVGIQNKLLEAMAMGLPVVATAAAHGGLSATPGRDVLVAETPAGFAEQVCRLLNSPAARQQLGQAGRRFVELHHQWAASARQIAALYQRAIQSRTGRDVGVGIAYSTHDSGRADASPPLPAVSATSRGSTLTP